MTQLRKSDSQASDGQGMEEGIVAMPVGSNIFGASVVNGELLVELAAREADRRKHKQWKRVSAVELVEVLKELGFKMVIA